MRDTKKQQLLGHPLVEDQADEVESTSTHYLDHGRTLHASESLIDIRAPSGQLELRLRMTEDGPVLTLDGVRLDITGSEHVGITCKQFVVNATESVAISSKGQALVEADEDLHVDSKSDVRIKGKKIYLN